MSRAKSTTRTSNGSARTLPRWRRRLLDELAALLGVEERLVLAHGGVDDGDDDLVEELRRAGDDVDVPVGDRVVGAGADGDSLSRHVGGVGSGCRRSGARRSSMRSGRSSGARRSLSETTSPPGASTAATAADSSRPSRGASWYGGSRKTRSYCAVSRAVRRNAPASARTDVGASGGSPGSPRRHAASRSTKVALAAPRDSASIPSAPEPANRSSTRAPCTAVAQDREQRLADAVGGRPRARRRLQPPALVGAGDDPHAAIGCRVSAPKRSCRAHVLEQRMRHRASDERLGVVARARRAASASSGSRAKRKLPSPDWRTPIELPLPAQLEVDLGEAEAVARARPAPAGAATPWSRTAGTGTRARRGRRGRAAGAAG